MNLLQKIEIAPLEATEIHQLLPLQPHDWNDITIVFQTHIGQTYFFPLKFTLINKIIGVGELIMNEQSAWLGNIIVRKDMRMQGIGQLITQTLMDLADEKGATLQLLLATKMGKGLYEKLGFEEVGRYLFFKKENLEKRIFQHENIRTATQQDISAIFNLDKKATGENRQLILNNHLTDCFVFEKEKKVSGFLMPNLGDGVVIAENFEAGIALFQLRENFGKPFIVLPEQHLEMIHFLKKQSYQNYREAFLMIRGKMKSWHPKMIFSRVGGYLG